MINRKVCCKSGPWFLRPRIRVWIITISVAVCVYLGMYVCARISKTACQNFVEFSVHIARGRDAQCVNSCSVGTGGGGKFTNDLTAQILNSNYQPPCW